MRVFPDYSSLAFLALLLVPGAALVAGQLLAVEVAAQEGIDRLAALADPTTVGQLSRQ